MVGVALFARPFGAAGRLEADDEDGQAELEAGVAVRFGTLLTPTVHLQFGEHFWAVHAGLTLAPRTAGAETET
jgi:hypothetical protein